MPFDLQDLEQLAHAIAHVNGHPTAADYAKSVVDAWHHLFAAAPSPAPEVQPDPVLPVADAPEADASIQS